MPDSIQFDPVPFDEASKIVEDRPVVSQEVFKALLPELRARTFLISGVEDMNVVQQIRDLIAEIPQGAGWESAKNKIVEMLVPWMDAEAANRRAILLMRHHGFQAYAAAHYAEMDRQRKIFPYWKYLSMGDELVREAHAALHGLILPADDPFWLDHFPPWDWGCRCQVISRLPRDYDEAIAENRVPGMKALSLEDRQRGWTLGPEGLKALRLGKLDLGDGMPVDVRTPMQRATTHSEMVSAYRWHPGDMKISLDQLRSRYDAETFAGFEQRAKSARLADGRTVWEWLEGKVPGPKMEQAQIDFDKIRDIKAVNRAEGDNAAFTHAGDAAAKAAAEEEARRKAAIDDSISGAKAFGSQLKRADDKVGGATGAFVMADPSGEKYVVKTYGGRVEQVRNEYIANRLYAAAGVDVPAMRLVEIDGSLGVASRMLENPKVVGMAGLDKAGKTTAVRKGFAVDAWLGNWDVAGLEGDNLLRSGRRYYRVDQGGALLFRAQGTPKGSAFGSEVGELYSLRDAAKNPAAAKLFAGLEDKEIARQVRSLKRKIRIADIDAVITKAGLAGDEGIQVREILTARLDFLKKWERDFSLAEKMGGAEYESIEDPSKLAAAVKRAWARCTEEERDGVKRLTAGHYSRINKALADSRRSSGRADSRRPAEVSGIDSALEKMPTYNGMWGRGHCAISDLPGGFKTVEKWASGEWAYWENDGYSHGTPHPDKVWDRQVKVFMRLNGRNGGYVAPVSSHPGEMEYILERGIRRRVVGIGWNKSKTKVIVVLEDTDDQAAIPERQEPPPVVDYDQFMSNWREEWKQRNGERA